MQAPSEAVSSQGNQALLPLRDFGLLLLLWASATIFDGVWLFIDHAPPAWDQGEHLTRALNYWRLLQQPHWMESDWWQQLWLLSPSYRAPLVYLVTVPVLTVLGHGFDQAVMVNSLWTAALLLLIYSLGRGFDRATGLWAAGLCLLVPVLVILRTDYLLDYGLTVTVLAAFACLTKWRTAGAARWLWAIACGITAGLVILAKPTGILFLAGPVVWVAVASLRRGPRQTPVWHHVIQWGLAVAAAWLICGPWIQTNWLTILSTSGNSNAGWLASELNPESPVSVWSYYLRMLPRMITYPLVILGIGGWLLLAVPALKKQTKTSHASASPVLPHGLWLFSMVVSTYVLFSLLHNKDPRHIVPCVPIILVLLVRGLTQWSGWPGRFLRIGLTAIMVVTMIGTTLPVGQIPTLHLRRTPYLGEPWPQPEVIDQVLAVAPYQRATIGVLPNIPQLNPMNVDFYGALADFRVFGREVGFNRDFAPLDARSLTWVLAKDGPQGPQNSLNEAKAVVQQQVEFSSDYAIQNTWNLPDGSQLGLYHRQPAPITVTGLSGSSDLAMTAIEVPTVISPGTVPITYILQGSWSDLQHGLLILSWLPLADANEQQPSWIHDHGIALGQLYTGFQTEAPNDQSFEVVERLAMIVPEATPVGRYRLQAEYVNRQTGAAKSLSIPETTVVVAASADNLNNATPEPDLVSQLHQLSQGLATGDIDPIFATVGRINQYDPIQDYLVQAELAMTQRLVNQPQAAPWLYTRVIAQVLQQHAADAIATLTQLTQGAPDNPYHWLYLAFVHIYSWQPEPADAALDQAEQLAPDIPELKLLRGAAALQRLRFFKAWELIKASGIL
ncbi:hypothetical protein C7271_05550 [filamentous cyanobacterium CCP5]|nr:hypothetical protein C7271_05550 [filamentous cyanobacterium CCP5]